MSAAPTIAERLAAWAAGLRLTDLPAPVVEIAKRCMIDVVGVSLAGARTASGKRLRGLASDLYAPGPCRVLGSNVDLTAPGAALANGAAAHALDFDDNCYAGIVHGSATTFPAVLAAAQSAGTDGETLLCGFVAGAEVQFALGGALTHAFYDRGWWSTAVLGSVGAAAGAGRIAGLDEARLAAAIGLAVAGTGGIRAVRGTEAKHYLCGRAAESGVTAALLAGRGASGPLDAFEDRNGFVRVFNDRLVDPAPLERIGAVWALETPGVDIKRYPTCYASHAAADAVEEILAEHRLTADDVARVVCEVPPLVASNLTYDRPRTANEAQFSLPFAVAAMIVFGEIGLEQLEEPALSDPRLRAMLERVETRVTDRFDAGPEVAERHPECAAITVITTTGERIERFRGAALGSAQRPLSRDALEAKFMACATRAVDANTAAAWLRALWAMEGRPPGKLLDDD